MISITLFRELFLEDHADVAMFTTVLGNLEQVALSPLASVRLIANLAAQLE